MKPSSAGSSINAVTGRNGKARAPCAAHPRQAVTGRSCYTSKYALSDRLFCGECGTLYRRKTRNIKGNIYHEWRCISRLEYGKKYCHESPTLRGNTTAKRNSGSDQLRHEQ